MDPKQNVIETHPSYVIMQVPAALLWDASGSSSIESLLEMSSLVQNLEIAAMQGGKSRHANRGYQIASFNALLPPAAPGASGLGKRLEAALARDF
jgi:hypothetical protein